MSAAPIAASPRPVFVECSRRLDMKKRSLRPDTWGALHDAPALAAAPPYQRALDYFPALLAAIAICGLLSAISVFVPPFIHWDSGWGFLAWRGTLMGAPNSIVTPDPANIARDTAGFLTEWSPGQYLIPGAIALTGIPLGIAMTLTAALSLLASLVGWVVFVKSFTPRTSLALLAVLLIALFRYSTMPFGVYQGGEILLQAATPWLLLAVFQIPEMDGAPAALFAAGAVLVAFLAKLTGLIVVVAALVASSVVALAFRRRITRGMIGGALGGVAALVVLFATFLSRGPTAVSEMSWSLPFRSIAFAFLVPWVAGLSWTDLMTTIFLPGRSLFYTSPAVVGLAIPPALLVMGLIVFWQPQAIKEEKLKLYSLVFYGIVAAVFVLLFIRGRGVSLEERHFRPAGTLVFVCALVSAFAMRTPRWTRCLFLILCALMALYGVASFSSRAMGAAQGQSLDRTSWTNQQIYDPAAVDFARAAYAREGRDALFVLPTPQIPVTLPADARILTRDLEWGEPAAARPSLRYAGRVAGHVFVLLPNSLSDTSKARGLLSAFTDYPPDGWQKKKFANMSVFFQ
jgi:hypothetical protein